MDCTVYGILHVPKESNTTVSSTFHSAKEDKQKKKKNQNIMLKKNEKDTEKILSAKEKE